MAAQQSNDILSQEAKEDFKRLYKEFVDSYIKKTEEIIKIKQKKTDKKQ